MVLNIQPYHVWGPEDRPGGGRLSWAPGDRGVVISERSLAGLAWTATGTISPASTTLRQTASSLQTSWSVTLFILGVLSFSFSLSVFQLSLDVFRYLAAGLVRAAQSLSVLQCFSPHDAPAMFKFSPVSQWDRSQSWTRRAPSDQGKVKLINSVLGGGQTRRKVIPAVSLSIIWGVS